MADFLYVPKCSDVYTQGIILYDKYLTAGQIMLPYKLGYTSNEDYAVKVGVYRRNGREVWVFGSRELVTSAGISLVSSANVVLFSVQDISSAYESGYYTQYEYATQVALDPNPVYIHVTVFDSLQEVLDAFGDSPAPGPGTGVVVTAIAAPSTDPPSTNGVIVTAVARISDPNVQGGISGTGGGQGTFDDTSYPVPPPSAPPISATDTGLVTLFKPTAAELNDLSNYLWTNMSDFIDNLNKLFVNPMDYIISLGIFPCNPDTGTSRAINVGNVTTEITMAPVISQWCDVNCGVINLAEYWGSALDYNPNTKISLFLPFIGSVSLNTDEVMNKNIGVQYRIDLLSGQCVALVTSNGDTYYQYSGHCSCSVPITGSDWSRIYTAAIGAIGAVATGAIAGISSGAAAGAVTSSGLPSTGITASGIANTIDNTVSQVMGGKLSINHSGSNMGSAGILGMRTAYLLIEYPNQSLADNYKHFVGYPSNIAYTLGQLSGYTEVEQVIIGISGTDLELAELIQALKGGVYL